MVDQHQGRDMMIGTDLLLEGAAAGGVIGRDLESEMTGKTDMDVCHGRWATADCSRLRPSFLKKKMWHFMWIFCRQGLHILYMVFGP